VKSKVFLINFLFLISIICSSCQADSSSPAAVSQSAVEIGQPQILPKTQASLSGQNWQIMLARNDEQRAQGLMFYESLPENEGMLFVYSSPRKMAFWMYNTRIELDIVFFSEDLMVTEFIKAMQPGYGQLPSRLPRYLSQMPAQYALELKGGMIEKAGIKVGDRLDIPVTMLYSE